MGSSPTKGWPPSTPMAAACRKYSQINVNIFTVACSTGHEPTLLQRRTIAGPQHSARASAPCLELTSSYDKGLKSQDQHFLQNYNAQTCRL